MTMSVTRRVVLPNTSIRITPRKRDERVPTCGNGSLAKETILAPDGSPLASVRRRHGTAARGTTERRQSRRTIRLVLSTSATLLNSRLLRWKAVSAAPVTTRSETFGWKFGQFGVDDRSGLTGPPCQALEPRSERRSTTARAAAWSRLFSLICCFPSPAKTTEADTRASVEAASADVVLRVMVRAPFPAIRNRKRA